MTWVFIDKFQFMVSGLDDSLEHLAISYAKSMLEILFLMLEKIMI